ncbi:S-adenosyl-L-methionine-dependent methyltransferase [Lipomyces kononenkoae]|uniref:S-adenosyl-L-methionine-dependent methyltransferase n=1 Tax=Lipomyces kononenkoae TaxID=34357 RepID=A0ACC3SRK2_LIPKO
MDVLVSQVQAMARDADEGLRKKLLDTLFSLQLSIESPQDSMYRLLYLNVYLMTVRIGCDLDIFRLLTDSPTSLTAQQVAEKCGTAPMLMSRLLRYLGSVGIIKETGPDTYTANQLCRTLTERGWIGGVYHYCVRMGRTAGELRQGMPTWLDKYPFLEVAKSTAPEQALFVDVGGGVGHQSVALRKALPTDIKNRIVVQDQAPVIGQAQPFDGVELILGAQPVLKHIKDAMAPNSICIIDEMVIPEQGAHWQATQLDMLMMTSLGAQERTEKQIAKLTADAGLKIRKIYPYTVSLNDCVIECVVA